MKNLTLLLLLIIFTLPSFAQAEEVSILGRMDEYIFHSLSDEKSTRPHVTHHLDLRKLYDEVFQNAHLANMAISILNDGENSIYLGAELEPEAIKFRAVNVSRKQLKRASHLYFLIGYAKALEGDALTASRNASYAEQQLAAD